MAGKETSIRAVGTYRKPARISKTPTPAMLQAWILAENLTDARNGGAPIPRLTVSSQTRSLQDLYLEDIMRLAVFAMLVVTALLAATPPSHACPPGYAACGTRYCCPR